MLGDTGGQGALIPAAQAAHPHDLGSQVFAMLADADGLSRHNRLLFYAHRSSAVMAALPPARGEKLERWARGYPAPLPQKTAAP
ncbi:hypothetical protein GCM10010439_69600 [Actinocorallia aurantiaca]|uniref:Uncharacterized protein n=1 Tax=Actinocorallia aurantiaca TaxID=46204 RepID=A0ABN3US84_9ACTN